MVVIILFSGQQRDADIKNRFGHSGVMILESSNGNIYVTVCKTDSKGEFSMCHREPNLVLCDNLEGWEGEVQEEEDTHIPMADSW